MGVLLAILFRLSHTFELIANTQRELRRAINRLGERYSPDRSLIDAPGMPSISQHASVDHERIIGLDDLGAISPRQSP